MFVESLTEGSIFALGVKVIFSSADQNVTATQSVFLCEMSSQMTPRMECPALDGGDRQTEPLRSFSARESLQFPK